MSNVASLHFYRGCSIHLISYAILLTHCRRISQGRHTLRGPVPIQMLRDMDQPFIFEVRSKKGRYRFEFYDTASPESWRLLHPDVVILCYDISQRSTLVNLQRVVCFAHNLLSSEALADNNSVLKR